MEEPDVAVDETEEESSGTASSQAAESGVIQVTTSKSINGEKREIELPLRTGRNVDEAVEMYGEEAVFDFYVRSIKIKFQAQVRDKLEAGDTDEAIAADFSDWDPTLVRTPTRDPASQVLSGFSKLSDEERLEMLAQLRAKIEEASQG